VAHRPTDGQGKHASTTVELLLGKHVPAAVVMPTMGETVCCLCGLCQRVIKRRELGQPDS
jgi:hypothetical protein